MGKWAGVKTMLVDFSGWTSAHGIPHIGSAQGNTLRWFWTVVTLVSLGMFSWQMSTLVTKFLSYQSSVQRRLEFKNRVFPSVTVCNLNPVMDIVSTVTDGNSTTEIGEDIHVLADKFVNARNASFDGTADSDLSSYGFSVASTETENTNTAAQELLFMAAQEQEAIETMLYDKDELVMNCGYNTKPCEDDDFISKYRADYGNCLTFNPEGKYTSTRAGPLYGLRLLLRTHQPFYQPFTKSAGVRVVIHENTSAPFEKAFGYNAAPGFATSFGIRYVQTINLPKPHGDCIETPSGSYNYEGDYIPEGCYRSCLNDQIVSQCGCFDPRLTEIDMSGTSCAAGTQDAIVQKLQCIEDVKKDFNVFQSCSQCYAPCNENANMVTISTAAWPSQVYKPPSCNNYDLTMKYWKSIRDCRDWYQKNTLLLEVYYERMNYEVLEQMKDYKEINLISDTGGQLGLWLGVSFITCVEFASLGAIVGSYICCGKANDGVDEDEDEDDSENEDDDAEQSNAAGGEA